MNGKIDRSKRNASMKAIPVLTRSPNTHSTETSDDSAPSAGDYYTTSTLVSSGSSSSVNSAVSRAYPSTAVERKNRLAPPPTSGTPEWYIKKIHEQTVSSKQLTALQTSLQGKDAEWVRRFVELGGMSVLARWLFHSNRQSSDAGIEFEVVKCLTYILNHRSATVLALAEGANEIVTHIASALDSPHLRTRRLLLDVLVFLVYWDDGANYQLVINGLEALSEDNDEAANAYGFWFKSLHSVLSGRGKMGTRVGASEQFKRSKADSDALTEYLMSNILLMNGIMQAIDDLDLRLHHRSQMETCGLQSIIKLAHDCGIPVIDTQLNLFQQTLEEDERSLEERMHQINSCDLASFDDVCKALRAKTKGSEKAETYMLSIFQHLLLIHQDGPQLVHLLQIVDSVVADLVMDKQLGGAEKRLGLSVERIVGQLEQVERARTAEDELVHTRTAALHLKIEKEALEDRVVHGDAFIANLQSELSKLRLENAKLSGTRAKPSVTSPSNTSYTDRLAQLADVLPGSPLALSYVPTSTPRSPQGGYKPSTSGGRQPFWDISSWFAAREDGSGVRPPSPILAKAGLGIMEMKEDLIVTTNISEKAAVV